jgi:hypothetical protein
MIRMVCDSATGYICNLEIYCGQSGSLKNTVQGLLQPFAGVGRIVYMDNFYNSVKLFLLQGKKFGVVGTMRKNHGIPKRMTRVAENLKRGEMTYKGCGDILVQAWREKQVVNMVSTIHCAEMTEIQNKRQPQKRMMKPECVADYNKYMHCVDTAGQHMSYYSFMRKSVKWTKKVFLYLLLSAVCSSHAMYKLHNPQSNLLHYLQNITEGMITKESKPPTTEANTESPDSLESSRR